MPPTQVQEKRLAIERARELFEVLQPLINDPKNGTCITLQGSSEKVPKYFDIDMMVNGTDKQNVCRVIVTEKMGVYSVGDVIMSSNKISGGEKHMKYISFNLLRIQVADIDNLAGLLEKGLLVRRAKVTPREETLVTQLKAEIVKLNEIIARQEPYVEYVRAIRAVPAPESVP
mmetsp:Transcript_29524/g.56739  ORF Transcript_29524/g.56739 Transcript_29524/m.56739 type:complete len:173 (-) Transcript_29524:495-1013(-)|eukprot:CAMPEP_0114247448 /NCGR_PEP_ID=MMETSP0058-20121206/13029_1 /TAXON_ID=36894 /ORGANISM="Pyramimonas parkeae, CCMP726" /LENGTH=172 /DNA_ID=CAMNT_0001360757 /DNA_START=196 /DNA_END=714 /DNA_ORIENTATION=-